ncbi:hypothetical protein RJ640_003582 [Escallonia rubra]|uniref:PGG domain-containing protein n=1 Tax=Escallonia rubra TaxID=112253 RepID=A0AA88QUK3_9ASTE|nr:hypothetical protein RJ640_003582 [Escallonia rubra]
MSSSNSSSDDEEEEQTGLMYDVDPEAAEETDLIYYLPLQRAIRKDEWDVATRFVEADPDAVGALLSAEAETPLILAAKQGPRSNHFLARLLERMTPDQVAQRDNTGTTALHAAAMHGNISGVQLLLRSQPALTNIPNKVGHLPLHLAAAHGHRKTVRFLFGLTRYDVEPNPYQGDHGVPMEIENVPLDHNGDDVENTGHVVIGFMFIAVPHMKSIRDTKSLHRQAVQLVKCLCEKLLCSSDADKRCSRSMLLAAKFGIDEIVGEILGRSSYAHTFADEDGHSVLHLAVMYRHENVFNAIVNGLSAGCRKFLLESLDIKRNNILHLAGYRAQQQQLDLVSSAVLQMQHELQWFKEVDSLVMPEQRQHKNEDLKTPIEVFYVEHADMVTSEGQWVTGMANSCTVATTIISTIAFASAITVPGGNKGDGRPVLHGETAFTVFAVSNALALFSSVSTLLVFLSVLTSRYAVIDYLYALPSRLIIGLITLFLSVTSMIIAFTAILILFGPKNSGIIFPVVVLASLPVTLFIYFQFPLLLNMMKSTYRPSKFMSFNMADNVEL